LRKFPYLVIDPNALLAEMDQLGEAIYLRLFLLDHQTDSAGWVHYGKPITYDWIAKRWPGKWEAHPQARRLKRFMSQLKALGLVEVHPEFWRGYGGMRLRVLRSIKFANSKRRPQQLAFGVREITSGKPCGKPIVSKQTRGDKNVPFGGTKMSLKDLDVKKQTEEKTSGSAAQHAAADVEIPDVAAGLRLAIETVAAARAVPKVELSDAEYQARLDKLHRQAEQLLRKTAG
jgi:hypothetical protein